jgi:hypothetical protein
MNYDIPPFLTYVRSEFLYDLKTGFGYFVPATIFSISIYKDEYIRFNLLADDQTLFNNIPINAFSNSKTAPKLSEDDCNFSSCIEPDCVLNQYEFLAAQENCKVWNKDNAFWQNGIYILTVEFPISKSQLHLIELEDGNYISWSSKNITWAEEVPDELPVFEEGN